MVILNSLVFLVMIRLKLLIKKLSLIELQFLNWKKSKLKFVKKVLVDKAAVKR